MGFTTGGSFTSTIEMVDSAGLVASFRLSVTTVLRLRRLASGLLLELLKTTGHPLPEETVIGVDQGYATGVFHIPDDIPANWKSVLTFGGLPSNPSRGALLWPLEGKRWIVSLGGRHGDVPTGDVDGFMAFAQGLRTPTVYNAVKNARLDGDIVRFGFRDNVLRHFDRLEAFDQEAIAARYAPEITIGILCSEYFRTLRATWAARSTTRTCWSLRQSRA